MKRFKALTMATLITAVFLILSQVSFSQINKRHILQKWQTDTTKHIVPLNELIVLLKRDAIKPIDNPTFVDKEEANKIFYEEDPVIAISINNKARAYPLGILTFHEIVNDEIDGVKFVVNYCPLCNTSNVYNRELTFKNKKYVLDFGTSGMLRKSNLVMWDRQTESWWQQITKKAIVGTLAGASLKQLPSMLLSVKEFFENYPNGKILFIKDTSEVKYGINPYFKYDNLAVKKPRLFFGKIDQRLPAMERVVGIDFGRVKKAYSFPKLRKQGIIYDSIAGKDIVIFFNKGQVSAVDEKLIKNSKDVGTATVFSPVLDGEKLEFEKDGKYFTDKKTKSKWTITGRCFEGKLKSKRLQPIPYSVEFSFAWFAFYPDSQLY